MRPEDKQVVHVKRAEHSCAQIERSWPANPKLTWKAKGLLTYFLSRRSTERITMGMIIDAALDGIKSVKQGMKELRHAGHAELIPIRDKKGRLIGTHYRIHEIPICIQPRIPKWHSRPTERPKKALSLKGTLGDSLFPDF